MLEIQEKVITAPFTSWLVGGPAEFFCLPVTIEDIKEAQAWAKNKNLPITILAGGSNILISDQGISGLTICLKKLVGTEVHDDPKFFRITTLAGTSKSELLKLFLKHKLAPALFLAGLPGDVGGGVVMNAGVAEKFVPREFGEIVEWVEVLKPDNEVVKLKREDIQWSYRQTKGWQPGIIIRVGIVWPMVKVNSILDQVREANKARITRQPLEMPTCGSVFANPEGFKAAQLIDSCGLKGYTVGGAQVSLKHANFIVNLGSATASDIEKVIRYVHEHVFKKNSVDLKTEVVFLGNWKK